MAVSKGAINPELSWGVPICNDSVSEGLVLRFVALKLALANPEKLLGAKAYSGKPGFCGLAIGPVA